jgi:hypothetical protein
LCVAFVKGIILSFLAHFVKNKKHTNLKGGIPQNFGEIFDILKNQFICPLTIVLSYSILFLWYSNCDFELLDVFSVPLGFYVLSNALSNRFCYDNAPIDAQYSVIFSHRSMNKVPHPSPPLL